MKTRNPKLEIRNKPKIQRANVQNRGVIALKRGVGGFGSFIIAHLNSFRFVFLKLGAKWLQFSCHKYSCPRLVLLRQFMSPLDLSASISAYERFTAFSGFSFHLSSLIPFFFKNGFNPLSFFCPHVSANFSPLWFWLRQLRISAFFRSSDLGFRIY